MKLLWRLERILMYVIVKLLKVYDRIQLKRFMMQDKEFAERMKTKEARGIWLLECWDIHERRF